MAARKKAEPAPDVVEQEELEELDADVVEDQELEEPAPVVRAGGYIDRGDGRGWVLEEE